MNDNFFNDEYSLENKHKFEEIIPLDERNKTRENLPDYSNEVNLLDKNVTMNIVPGDSGDKYKNTLETDVTDLQFKQELITKDVVKRNNENIL